MPIIDGTGYPVYGYPANGYPTNGYPTHRYPTNGNPTHGYQNFQGFSGNNYGRFNNADFSGRFDRKSPTMIMNGMKM